MLIPREHGAYGQLLFPLATVLAAGRPSPEAWAIVTAGLCGFLAHEGLAVWLGRRGGRALREGRRAAVRSIAVWGGVGLVAGMAAFLAASRDVRIAVLVTLALAGVVMTLVMAGRERTLAGEILVAMTLSSWSVAAGLASGLSMTEALGAWAVWTATFAVATLGVRGVIARTRGEPWRRQCAGAVLVGGAAWWGLHGLALDGVVAPGMPLALAPAGLLSGASWLPALSARHLHRIGWSIAAICLVTCALLFRALRSA